MKRFARFNLESIAQRNGMRWLFSGIETLARGGFMACLIVKSKTLGKLFICGEELDVSEDQICAECGDLSDSLCDFPVGDGKTCDRSLCAECAKEIAPNLDYCPGHFGVWKAYRDSNKITEDLGNVVPFKGIG